MNVGTTDKGSPKTCICIYIDIQILFINLLLKVENFGQGNNELELEEDTCLCRQFVCCENGRVRLHGNREWRVHF